eukprot:jgi/Psemu1/16355/gm1.16355_g
MPRSPIRPRHRHDVGIGIGVGVDRLRRFRFPALETGWLGRNRNRNKINGSNNDDDNNIVIPDDEEDADNEDEEEPLKIATVRCPFPDECDDDEEEDPSAPTPGVAESLHGRLLCASECAYEIEAPYLLGSGFVAGSNITRLSAGVNSCVVGTTKDGIVVAFRGTVGGPLDWLQNAALFLKKVPREWNAPKGCKVHLGFYGAIRKRLGAAVKKVLLRLLADDKAKHQKNNNNNNNNNGDGTNEYKPPKIYLTGHSKGGSLASLYALQMINDPELPSVGVHVCTFGASRVGNAAFATHYDGIVEQVTYENDLDVIPFLPPGKKTMDDMMAAAADTEDPYQVMAMMNEYV